MPSFQKTMELVCIALYNPKLCTFYYVGSYTYLVQIPLFLNKVILLILSSILEAKVYKGTSNISINF